jgi:hypothetical protein
MIDAAIVMLTGSIFWIEPAFVNAGWFNLAG